MSRREDQNPLFGADSAEENTRLRNELETVQKELTRLNDRHMILLKDQEKRDRSVRAAANKTAWEHVAHTYRWYLVGEVKSPLSHLCAWISRMPEHPSADEIRRLKWAAEDAQKLLSEHDNETTPLLAENKRLCDAIQKQAALLHRRFGYEVDRGALSATGRCECPGCELVRSVHEVPLPEQNEEAEGAA